MSGYLSEHDTGRDVVVFEPAGVTDRGQEVMVWKVFEVSDIDVLLQFTETVR